jgi:hypothetical protein
VQPTRVRRVHAATRAENLPPRRVSAGAFSGRRFTTAHFEAVTTVYRLDVEDLAARDSQDTLHRSGDVLVHPVRELDDDHGPLAWCSHQTTGNGSCALAKLAQDHVHVIKSSIVFSAVYWPRLSSFFAAREW